jgi:hypothetical protein
MHVDAQSFWKKLPVLLESIADADFVSMDFEMSGVRLNRATQAPHTATLSLQEAYVQAKWICSTFNIVQAGLTCTRRVAADEPGKLHPR